MSAPLAKKQKLKHEKTGTDFGFADATSGNENPPANNDSLFMPAGCDETSYEDSFLPVDSLNETDGVCDDMTVSSGIYPSFATSKYEELSSTFRTSIYVDAFNLALDTVLEQESHLFDEKENLIFEEWRRLSYEAQFLYVRLFLRKTSQWHRCHGLGYHSDISDLDSAIALLKQSREFSPKANLCSAAKASTPEHKSLASSSFAFVECSTKYITTLKEAISLLSLAELKTVAKQVKINGKTKADLLSALINLGATQKTLTSGCLVSDKNSPSDLPLVRGEMTALETHLFQRSMTMTGPCIRVTLDTLKTFERVHLVFYRTTEWTEKSLRTILLARFSKVHFPHYIVSRTANIFESRQQLLEFEEALELEHRVDQILDSNGPVAEADFMQAILVFVQISDRWRLLLEDELAPEKQSEEGEEGSYLRRFKAAHVYTRLAHKAAYSLGRLHEYAQEHALLVELLGQRHFHISRRGAWYQRKALLEEHYMSDADRRAPMLDNPGQQKKLWLGRAAQTCEQALEDPSCHVIYHYDLQKRLLKLERRLRIPRRLQHDFGHLQLVRPERQVVKGIQIRRRLEQTALAAQALSTKTIWVDESDDSDSTECSVETMCLNHYRREGWKGFHSEGGIVRTLFAYLFYDVLFLPVPNVFQTAYQTCPLDLYTDAFYPARASEINQRLARIANGEAEHLAREVHSAHANRRTSIVGLNWDFELQDIVEVIQCFRSDALATICKVLAQEYGQRVGGLPDLLLWRLTPQPAMLFAEVKSANDSLSDTQRLWIHVLASAGVRVLICDAVAQEERLCDGELARPQHTSISGFSDDTR